MKRTTISCLFLLLCVTLAQAQTPTANDSVVNAAKAKEEIRKILQELADAWPKKDQKTFDRHLAPSFLAVNPEDGIVTKPQVLAGVGSGKEMPPAGMKFNITIEDLEVSTDTNSAVATYHEVFRFELNQNRGGSRQRVSAFFVRRDSAWQVLAQHRTYLGLLRSPKQIDSKALDAIVGEYQTDEDGKTAIVTREGDKVYSQKTASPKLELVPDNDSTFYAKTGTQETALTFIRDNEGKVMYMVVHDPLPGSRVLIRKKIK